MNNYYQKKEQLVDTLNTLIDMLEPITHEEFNVLLNLKYNDGYGLKEFADAEPNLSVVVNEDKESASMSMICLIDTITKTLCGDKLVFKINHKNIRTGVEWSKNESVLN